MVVKSIELSSLCMSAQLADFPGMADFRVTYVSAVVD
jgi:hypothetical protein